MTKTTFELSSGGIVFHRKKDNNVYLLLKHTNGHWSIPKGHQEKEESLKETALRETTEETSIPTSSLQVLQKLDHITEYWFHRDKDTKVHKKVYLFLIKADTTQVTLSFEHEDYAWVKFEGIEQKLTYHTSLPAFEEAHQILSSDRE